MNRRRMAFALITALLTVALTEILSFVGLLAAQHVLTSPPIRAATVYRKQSAAVRALLQPGGREVVDSVLGWHYRAGYSNGGDSINLQGLRSSRLYSLTPQEGITRVAAFGDSFVYGNEVSTNDAWATQVQTSYPAIEVLNYGVGGYGVDQALLRYQLEGRRFSPKYVIMGFVADDLRRVVNVYRRFVSADELPLTKPRFVLEGDSLRLIPPPVRRPEDYDRLLAEPTSAKSFGVYDQWYRPEVYDNPLHDWSATVRLASCVWRLVHDRFLDPDRLLDGSVMNARSDAFRLQLALFEHFAQVVQASGARPIVMFFPDRDDLTSLAAGQSASYAPLIREAQRRGIDVLDLAAAFPLQRTDVRLPDWFAPGGHYSPAGNRLVATAVGESIRARVDYSEASVGDVGM
jgi:GDSL-like Lipase/Acylhydrolase family